MPNMKRRACRARLPICRARYARAGQCVGHFCTQTRAIRSFNPYRMQAFARRQTGLLSCGFLLNSLDRSQKHDTCARLIRSAAGNDNSMLAPALFIAANVLASPPGRSAISPAQTSTFLTVYAIAHLPF